MLTLNNLEVAAVSGAMSPTGLNLFLSGFGSSTTIVCFAPDRTPLPSV